MTNFNKRFAFTLSELLLSLIIVGVVAIITVPVLINNVQKKVFATQLKNFVAQIEQVAQDELLAHRTRDLSNTDFADPDKLLSNKHFDYIKKCSSGVAKTTCWNNPQQKIKLLNNNLQLLYLRTTIILKNGVMLSYIYAPSTYRIGYFIVDLNGTDKPNIGGRDIFVFDFSLKGKLIIRHSGNPSLETLVADCKSNFAYCHDAVILNNWKMDY